MVSAQIRCKLIKVGGLRVLEVRGMSKPSMGAPWRSERSPLAPTPEM